MATRTQFSLSSSLPAVIHFGLTAGVRPAALRGLDADALAVVFLAGAFGAFVFEEIFAAAARPAACPIAVYGDLLVLALVVVFCLGLFLLVPLRMRLRAALAYRCSVARASASVSVWSVVVRAW